jgi:hypothetical protein
VPFDDQASGVRGWFLGHAIDPDLKCRGLSNAALAELSGVEGFRGFELVLGRLSGRFAVVAFSPTGSRFYLDAAGQLSAVYCRHRQIVASTTMLIPYDSETADDEELVVLMRIPRTNAFYPFGVTPRFSVHRLLPNHFLDLDRWQSVRHWPMAEIPLTTDPQDAVAEIASILRRTLEVVCESSTPYLSLTAGRDSRMLLACARGLTDRISFFTWELPDAVARTDVVTARRLAKRFRLPHQVYPFSEATEIDTWKWLYRTGLAVGEVRGLSLATTVARMERNRLYLPALGAEVGRAFYWRESDEQRKSISAVEFVNRLRLPPVARILEGADDWMAGLPVSTVYSVLDFGYLEQRLACWAGVTAYGDAEGPVRLPPFSSRRIFELMLGLPHAFRRQQQLADSLIERSWPELLEIPFNTPTLMVRIKNRLSRMPLLGKLDPHRH